MRLLHTARGPRFDQVFKVVVGRLHHHEDVVQLFGLCFLRWTHQIHEVGREALEVCALIYLAQTLHESYLSVNLDAIVLVGGEVAD